MNRLIFIIIIVVILILFKIYNLKENFETNGIYNYFHQEVMNPYKYPMIPFFTNDKQQLPKPSPPHSDY